MKPPERQSRPLLLSPIATPSREVSPSVSFYQPQNLTSKPEHPKILSPYKQFHQQIEKELFSQPVRSSHTILKYFISEIYLILILIRTIIPTGDQFYLPQPKNDYKPHSSYKNKFSKRKLSASTTGISPSNSIMFTTTTTVNSPTPNESFNHDLVKLGIGQTENTLTSPAFTNTRADFYKTFFITETKPNKEIPRLDSTLTSVFPKRNNKDFVYTHSQGFTIPENIDLYKHLLRHILKNQHLFVVKPAEKPAEVWNKAKPEPDVDYVPLKIKQLILENTKEQMALLSHIPDLYELKMGTDINSMTSGFDQKAYHMENVEKKLEKENNFLQDVLHKINENGIETVNFNDMIKFKKIVRRRLHVFNQLEDFIKNSGALEKETQNEDELAAQEELQQTVQRIKEIRANLDIEDIPKSALSPLTTESPENKLKEELSPISTQPRSRTSSISDFSTHRMVDSILQSVITFRNVKNAINTLRDKSSPNDLSLETRQKSDAAPRLSLFGTNNTIGEENDDGSPHSQTQIPQRFSALYQGDPKAFLEAQLQKYQNRISQEKEARESATSKEASPKANSKVLENSPKGGINPFNFLKFKMIKKKKNPNTNVRTSMIASRTNTKDFERIQLSQGAKSSHDSKTFEEIEQKQQQPEILSKSDKISENASRSKIPEPSPLKFLDEPGSPKVFDGNPFSIQKVKPSNVVLSQAAQMALKHLGKVLVPNFLSQATGGVSPGVKPPSSPLNRSKTFT